MPLIDLPLEKLHQYQGRNPCPADMDRFWTEGLAEMRAVDPHVQLVPRPSRATFADCFDLTFTGVGGARVYAKYARPRKGGKKRPAVVMFHGYTGNSGDWLDKLAYAAQGLCVAALDCRGQGGRSEDVGGVKGTTYKGQIIRGLDDAPEKLLFRQIYLDCAQLAGIVMGFPEVDAERVAATGGSQGGGLTLACAALEPRIRRCAPIFPFLCDYQRVWEMDLAVAAYEELKTFFRQFDPRHERESEIFTRLGYIDNQHLASRIQADTLMFTGLMDTICPPSTQFAAYNRIRAAKDVVIYPDFGHEGLPGATDQIFEFLADL